MLPVLRYAKVLQTIKYCYTRGAAQCVSQKSSANKTIISTPTPSVSKRNRVLPKLPQNLLAVLLYNSNCAKRSSSCHNLPLSKTRRLALKSGFLVIKPASINTTLERTTGIVKILSSAPVASHLLRITACAFSCSCKSHPLHHPHQSACVFLHHATGHLLR